MGKLFFWVIFLCLNLIIEGRPQREAWKLMRPSINNVQEQRCQGDYQTTMLDLTNKYRSLDGLKPLLGSKKLQYVALLAAQRCQEFKSAKKATDAVKSLQLFNTTGDRDDSNSFECKTRAFDRAFSLYERVKECDFDCAYFGDYNEKMDLLKNILNYTYMGCAVSLYPYKYKRCDVCYYQNDQGVEKLKLNILPPNISIDLESYNDSFWTQFHDTVSNNIIPKNDPLDRPIITSLEEQKCQEDYQNTMLDNTNKYRSWYGLEPLQVSKKLQYVALLAAQRCHVLGKDKAAESFRLFVTDIKSGFDYNTSSTECEKIAAAYFYQEPTSFGFELKNTYMSCAVSIVNHTACQVCFYQNDKGADKLKANIVSPNININLESYNDSFWTQFPDAMFNNIVTKNDPLDRPTINSVEEQRCQEDYQSNMLEHTNKYRSLYGLEPLQVSKKLQYVALLAAQRCHVLGNNTSDISSLLFNTVKDSGFVYNTSSIECQEIVNRQKYVDNFRVRDTMSERSNSSYMGCGISILNSLGCYVCYYQDEKGADKLKLNILPPNNNIELVLYNDSFWTHFQDTKFNYIDTKSDPLDRPINTVLDKQRCQEDFQTTLLEQNNKYRNLKDLEPLQVSKKLQYVALLASQRCHVLGDYEAAQSFLLFNTVEVSTFNYYTSLIDCKKYAILIASHFYDRGNYWAPFDNRLNYTYMGCAVSFFYKSGCNVCYYQDDEGADKLKLNIVPPNINLELESYNDSFWTQFTDPMVNIKNETAPKVYELDTDYRNYLFP